MSEPEFIVNACARAAYESIPVDEADHIGGWLELHAEAREFWRHRAEVVLEVFHKMRRSSIHETPEIRGPRMMLLCIYCGRIGHRMVLDTDLAPPVPMCEDCHSKTRDHCGCCGREIAQGTDEWCIDCLREHIDTLAARPEDRTWFAQHGTDCPFVRVPVPEPSEGET